MRTKLSILFILGLSVGLFWSQLGFAVELPKQVTGTQAVKPFDQRLTERKQKFSLLITNDKIARLGDKCDGAQLKLGAISTRFADLKRRRMVKYGQIIDDLTLLDQRLSDQKIAHEDFGKELAVATAQWVDLQSTMEEYAVALDDARTIDCEADPAGFLVSLAAARQYQVTTLERNDNFLKQLSQVKTNLVRLKSVVTVDSDNTIGMIEKENYEYSASN